MRFDDIVANAKRTKEGDCEEAIEATARLIDEDAPPMKRAKAQGNIKLPQADTESPDGGSNSNNLRSASQPVNNASSKSSAMEVKPSPTGALNLWISPESCP